MDIKEADILGDDIHHHWYYVSKARALQQLIRHVDVRRVLDVGAGSGIFSRILLASTAAESAVCVDPGYDGEHEEEWAGKPLVFRRQIGDTDADLALFMDVLEHVDEDAGLLRQYARMLRPGAHVVVTVPAFQFLFSGHDVFLEHRRRYTVEHLESVVRDSGLDVVTGRYFFAALFPLVVMQRLFNRLLVSRGQLEARSSLRRHSPPVNSALKALHAAELPFFNLNRLAGLSVFCLARIPEDHA